MFTGLIEEMGSLRGVDRRGEAMILTIQAAKVLEDVNLGDSIAVNGVCLTVVSYDARSFSVDVMPETYRHTNLHTLQTGSPLNLERAMLAGGRYGGHIVQGHVDGTGVIRERRTDANAIVFTIEPHSRSLLRYVIPQGSVTLDGISLTVVSVDQEAGKFTVSIIPHTLKQTILQHKHAGDTINIENDILGKYIDHLIHAPAERSSADRGKTGGLTEAMLRDNGFF